MYCDFIKGDCFSGISCADCYHFQNKFLPTSQQYNYKCSCGGEFLQPIYKWISTEVKEIGTSGIVANAGQGYYGYVCPFCGKPMEGMNG